jgi:hypothetical protein
MRPAFAELIPAAFAISALAQDADENGDRLAFSKR